MSRAHDHVITLTHLDNGLEQADCECGRWSAIGLSKTVRALIAAHRMESFPILRYRLTQ